MTESPRVATVEAIKATFTDEVNRRLLSALNRSYEFVSDGHVESEGDNGRTFGTRVYETSVFRLQQQAEVSHGLFSAHTSFNKFRLRIGNFIVGSYKVGESERQKIDGCFPSPDNSAGEMFDRGWFSQPTLPLLDSSLIRLIPQKLILAHLGNPDDGFCAAYVCAVGSVRGKAIASWGVTHKLWSREEGHISKNKTELAKPENEIIPDFDIKPRKPRDASEND